MRARAPIEWRTWPEAVGLILRGATIHATWRIAVVVGTLLTIVNQGGVILAGEATPATWIRSVVNYCVPFVVSSLGFLIARRIPDSGASSTP
ncbi:MAG: nitrate/nitrite transporter NrtS [Acidimicrobiia bacterium]